MAAYLSGMGKVLGGSGGKSLKSFTPNAYTCLETVLGSSIMPVV